GDHLASQVGRLIFEPGVDHEGAATGLRLRDDDVTAFSGEDARCGLVDVLEEYLLDAAREHADTTPRRICCDNMGREMLEQVGRNLREQRFHCGYALREKAQNAGRADEALQSGALIEEHGKSEEAQTAGVG